MNYLGDFNTGSTVYVYLTTHTAMGVPVAPSSAFEAADFILYKNGSATQRTSQAGWTITSPFDSVTGLHVLAIDLSDNTDSGFYAAGSTYTLVLSPDETVDGLAVAAVVAQFSIERVTKVNVTYFNGVAAQSSFGYLHTVNGIHHRRFYVSASIGNDSNNGLTPATPMATYAAAQTLATAGDEIAFTDSYTSKVSVTKSGLTLTSAGGSVSYSGSDNTSTNAGAVFVGSGVNYTTLLNLNISGTDATDGTGVRFGDASDTTTYSYGNAIIGCKLVGKYDCVYMHLQRGLRIENVHAPGTFDGGYFYKTQARCINSIFYTDGSYSTAHAHRGVVCGPECDIEFINCQLEADRSASSTIDIAGFHSVELPITSKRSNFVFRGGTIYANHSHSGSTARVSAIDAQNVAGTRYGYCVELNGTVVKSSNAGAGAVYDIHLPTDSLAKVSAPGFADRSKINLAGTATVEWPVVDNSGLSDANTVKVGPTGAGTEQTAVDLATILGTPTNDSLAEDIAAIQVATGTAPSPFNVDKDHTWKFDSPSQTTAPNTISEVIGFNALLSMDFTEPLPARSAISTVTSATFANIAGTEPTVTSSAKTANAKGVNILVDTTSATAGTYTLSVKVVTTDSQTFVRKGRLTIS